MTVLSIGNTECPKEEKIDVKMLGIVKGTKLAMRNVG